MTFKYADTDLLEGSDEIITEMSKILQNYNIKIDISKQAKILYEG